MENQAVELEEADSLRDVVAINKEPVTDQSSPSETVENVHGDKCKGTITFFSILAKLTPSRGMLVALLATVFFSCGDVSVELATREVHPNLLLVLYPSVIMVSSFVGVLVTRAEVRYDWKYYLLLVVSGGFYAGGSTCLTIAISKIPVGDAVAILNCMPIFAGIFGWMLLKQSLRLLDLVFSVLCIAGVVLISRPSFIFPASKKDNQTDLIGTLFALAASCFIALALTISRKLQDNGIHVLCITFINALLTVFFNAMLCTYMKVWSAPSPSYYWAIAFAPGVFGFFAQTSLVLAIRMERAVTVTIILSLGIIFTFVLQILIVKIIPHWHSAIGSFLILVSCIGLAARKEVVMGQDNN